MKREQRAPWLALIVSANDWALCSFCRYADWFCEDDWSCEHPLGWPLELGRGSNYVLEPGDDCWGFRPEKGLTLDGARERLADPAEAAAVDAALGVGPASLREEG